MYCTLKLLQLRNMIAFTSALKYIFVGSLLYGFCAPVRSTTKDKPHSTIPAGSSPPCPTGWTSLATGCYKFINQVYYNSATFQCKNEGGYLAEVTSQGEQNALWKFYNDSGLPQTRVKGMSEIWLGANDRAKEGDFVWANSGNKMLFNAWSEGEPNGGKQQNCVQAWGWLDFKWVDQFCHNISNAVCEFNTTAAVSLSKWGTGTQLEVTRTHRPENFLPLVLGCTIQKSWQTCTWTTPKYQNIKVENGRLVDETGQSIDWAEVWTGDNPQKTCGIRIFEKIIEHSGDWKCQVEDRDDFWIEGIITTQGEATTNMRLPKEIMPLKYKLFISPDLLADGNYATFFGIMTMDLKIYNFGSAMNYVMFHSNELNITQMTLKKITEEGKAEDAIIIRGIGFDYWRNFVFVYSDTLLRGNYRLNVVYDSVSKDPAANRGLTGVGYGLYKVPCLHNKQNLNIMNKEQQKFCWFTQFEATDARRAFPCLDEPSLKAPFDITIRGREGWKILSNMPLQETVRLGGGEFLDRFETSVPMSPYLVAFAITDYVGVEGDDHRMTIWAPKRDVDAGRAEHARKVGVQLLDFFESYLNVPYSLPKIDLISVPEKDGAMENWGLVMFSPRLLLVDPTTAQPTDYWRNTKLIAHELSHQWFGNLVTCFWWSQLWLNEGFATYFEYLGPSHVEPESHAWGRFLLYKTQDAFNWDKDLKHTQSLSFHVESRSDIGMKANPISYSKGGSFLRMVESVVTTASFTKSLTAYLKKQSFDKGTEDDLFYHLQTTAKEDGNWPVGNSSKELFYILKDWTHKKGVPLVTVDRDWNNNGETATLNQTMYVTIGEPMGTKWDIPISYWTPGGSHDSWQITTPKIWLNKEMDNVTIKDLPPNLPLVVNVQATGYYRVNYDDKSWRIIGDTLAQSHKDIHPLNRVQIICDVLTLNEHGFISEEIKQHVLGYKDKEHNYVAYHAFRWCERFKMTPMIKI